MLKLLRQLTFVIVIIHLFLLLAESSYFGDLFAFLGHTGLMITHVVILTLISLTAACFQLRKQLSNKPYLSLSVTWALYTLWVVFCSLHSVHTTDRLCELILTPLTIVALFLCAPLILERQHYRLILLSFSVLLGLHTLCIAWIMFKNNPEFFGRQVITVGGRPKFLGPIQLPQTDGIFRSPNAIGSFLALFPAFLLSEFLSAKNNQRYRTMLIATAVLIGAGLFLSYCRAAQASVLIGFLLPAIVFLKNTQARFLVCAAILVTTAIVCLPDQHQWMFMNSSMAEHNIGPEAVRNSTAFVAHTVSSRRTEIWMGFLKHWQEHPWTGYGLLGVDYQNLGPHNFFLANLAYFGIPGLVLIVTLLCLAIKQIAGRAINQPRILIPLLGGLASLILVHGSLEYSISYPEYFTNSVFWLLLGYASITQFEDRILKDDDVPKG